MSNKFGWPDPTPCPRTGFQDMYRTRSDAVLRGENPPTLGQLLKAKLGITSVAARTNHGREFEGPDPEFRGIDQAARMKQNPVKTKSQHYQSNHTGEKKMHINDTEANMLVKLADQNKDIDDLAKYEVQIPSSLSADLKELMEEEAKHNSKQAARTILNVLKAADIATESDVNELRRLRQQEKAIKTRMDARARAKAYGADTNNYLPLSDMVSSGGMWMIPAEKRQVPKDWTPTPVAAEAAAK